MRKTAAIIALALTALCIQPAAAQTKMHVFNHFGVGVSASTMGIGFDVAAPITKLFTLRAGLDIMPGFNINTDVNVAVNADGGSYGTTVNIKGDVKRTQGSVLINFNVPILPIFICGGVYFGGEDVARIKGQSQALADLYAQYGSQAGVIIGDYKLPIEPDGSVSGGVKVKNVRPYVGIGTGKTMPKSRLGFSFELGVQFHSTPTVYSTAGDVRELMSTIDENDTFSKIIDKLTVYPVVKFRLTGRIL